MGSVQQRRSTEKSREKKIYIPKTYRKKDIQQNVWAVYRFIYPYLWGSVCLMVAAMMGWGVLAYNPNFPSWSTVTTVHTDISWLDYVMNFQTDFLLQMIGIGMFLHIVNFIVWGGFLVSRRRISHLRSRVLFAVLSSGIFSVIGAACEPQFMSIFSKVAMLMPAGFGGAFGRLILTYLAAVLNVLPSSIYYLLISALGLLGISLFVLSLGFSNQQIQGMMKFVGRIVLRVGKYAYIAIRFVMHATALIAQRIKDRFSRHPRGGEPIIRKSSQSSVTRREPAFDTSSTPEEDFDDDDESPWGDDDPVEPVIKKGIVESFKEKTFKKPDPRKTSKTSRSQYQAPSLDLLTPSLPSIKDPSLSRKALEENAERLMRVLNEFGIKGRILGVKPGPVVTLYELEPAAGVKSARIISLADDIARSMSARSARVSVISGRNAMGIELPNEHRETVYFREILSSSDFQDNSCQLPLGLGKDIGGHPIITDLAKMPHLLVAGTTGSGKSVGINAMILSLLYKLSPDECKFIMIDPKMLELSVYDGIPHLLSPVVTEPKKAIVALKWVVQEMEARYRAMAQLGVRNIQGYNDKLRRATDAGEVLSRRVQTGFDSETGIPVFEDQALDMTLFPYIVVVVDEMADLMLVAGKEIEAAVQRLAQMARAAGIHLIMATQRPSVDVITGTIKANFPTRIGFQVTSKIDSRTILGEQGAEQLLGRGDMLYMEAGGRIRRVHGAFVADDEVERIVTQLKVQQDPSYVDIYAVAEDAEGSYDPDMMGGKEGSGDELYDKALSIVLSEGKVSTSFIQRHLSIGYNRAAKIVDVMEKEGVISAPNHVGKREILVPHERGR
ncbi:MAG: DNA translocase FtsK 4TM domain-containing protein [Alphaproteobacteria bacterium]|nr:DNA translocase FtsK 4TM domain-containing protein [Alphaproteobacteria bacterium]